MNSAQARVILALGLAVLGLSCSRSRSAEPAVAAAPAQMFKEGANAPAEEQVARKRDVAKKPAPGRAGGGALKGLAMADAEDDKAENKPAKLAANTKMEADATVDGVAEPEPAVPTRSWFPESFLFEPRLVTDEGGLASLDFKIPDRLTTWRILGLAHTRQGQQAGAVAEVLGTLPVYVEAVVPSFLTSGDVVSLPIQVVNTTEARVDKALTLSADGAVLGSAGVRPLSLAAGRTAVETATLRATKPGVATLRAALAGTDAVERSIPIHPRGQPVVEERGGTLAAPRTLEIELPARIDREATELELSVYPGALALLRSEIASAGARQDPADAAYALELAGQAPALASALGGEVDAEAVRLLRILGTQRALRSVRTPSVEGSILFAEAAAQHPKEPLLSRLGERLFGELANLQRPDGTFSGQTGWTLQRLLVTTAEGTAALQAAATTPAMKSRAAGAKIRASGVFERNAGRIEDPYTAAMVLVSGAVDAELKKTLQKKILDAVEELPDHSRRIPVPASVVRADGSSPSDVELAAVAALALEGADPAVRQDLGAHVLSAYRPYAAFGDGRANLWCLRAVLALFRDKLPAEVKIALEVDGKPVKDGLLDTARIKDVLHLNASAPDAEGLHKYTVRADPPVPGLGFVLRIKSWAPVHTPTNDGLDLRITTRGDLRIGRPIAVDLLAVAPSGLPLTLEQGLPAGVQPDRASLEALVAAGTVERFQIEDGRLTLVLRPLAPATPFRGSYRAYATLAGTLNAAPSVLRAAGAPEHPIESGAWSIRP
ncbi:MAG: alpha-2-macroglobulin family protein [Myxococcota bacterium]